MATTTDGSGSSKYDEHWKKNLHEQVVVLNERLKNRGTHLTAELIAGGFEPAIDGKMAKCNKCGVEISDWSENTDFYRYHYERNANCPFIRSKESKRNSSGAYREQGAKRQKTELGWTLFQSKSHFSESKLLHEVRVRSFSQWNQNTRPTKEQMMTAGFFQCSVGDRVICLYCNLIAQQWQEDTDDPVEVHTALSPHCCFVRALLTSGESSTVSIVNENLTRNSTNNTGNNSSPLDPIVYTSAVHANYTSIPSRQATYTKWNSDALPAVDDMVQAGYFYTGTGSIATCFYCGGSLQNWSKTDKPIVEHIRWFPLCQYAKQLAGDKLYNKIQEAKRARAAREAAQVTNNTAARATVLPDQQLQIPDDRMLSRLVAARLDLPISQRLLDNPFKLSVIKRCWEDQLQIKHDDFFSDVDLFVACLILQKQIEHINGNKDNIIIPSIKMRAIREGTRAAIDTRADQTVVENNPVPTSASSTSEPMTVENNSDATETQATVTEAKAPLNNPCILCSKEEKRLACIPCGHLVACSNCHQSLRTCPVCRRSIEAFVRIYT